jgi:hypothetical protein
MSESRTPETETATRWAAVAIVMLAAARELGGGIAR